MKVSSSAINLCIESEISQIDEAVIRLKEELKAWEMHDSQGMLLILRELLLNAVIHGNVYNKSKKVEVRIYKAAPRYHIEVLDQGTGFAFADLDLSKPEDPRQIKPRGLKLVSLLAEELVFQGRGNCIQATFLDPYYDEEDTDE